MSEILNAYADEFAFEAAPDLYADVAELEKSAAYAEEALVADAQFLILSLMEDQRLTRANLAARMDVSKARVTQVLGADTKNLTLKLLARACHAMDTPIRIVRADQVVAKKRHDGHWCIGPSSDDLWQQREIIRADDRDLVHHLAQAAPDEPDVMLPDRNDLPLAAVMARTLDRAAA